MTQSPQPQQPQQHGVLADLVPSDIMREEVMSFLVAYLGKYSADRGGFQVLKEDGNSQQIPGVTVPPWLAQALSSIAGHPLTPYNHDRAALVRDALYLMSAAYASVLMKFDQDNDGVKQLTHIIRQEEMLRREMYVEELMYNFVEDLAIASGVLELKIAAGSRQAVYETLQRLFFHIGEIQDQSYWRPLLLKFMLRIPEVQEAMRFVGEQEHFRHDPEFTAWRDMLASAREDEQEEIG